MTYLRECNNIVRSYPKPQNNAIAGCTHVELQREAEGDRERGETRRGRDGEKFTMMIMLIVKITMQQGLGSIRSILPFSTERRAEKFIAQQSQATQRQKAEERMCHGCLYGNKLTLEKMRQNPINTAAGESRKTPWDSQ